MFKKFIPLAILIATYAQAENIGVEVNSIKTDADTTISIKKGDSGSKKKYTISEGEDDISGDKDVLKKTAEKNWRKACDSWKSELKENNKENRIISSSCGVMNCSKEGVESSCTSKATYKVRVLSEE